MYTSVNFKTKKEFREAVERGLMVTLRAPGIGRPEVNGTEYVEGPWYPQPHRWYATVEVKDGKVVKVR